MAYFDSAKNRVLWQRELQSLRAERERRSIEGYDPDLTSKTQEKSISNRVKISFVELERQEAAASKTVFRNEKRSMEKSSIDRQREKNTPEMHHPKEKGPRL